MTIETKLSINDKVWMMKDNYPREFIITEIDLVCFSTGNIVTYKCIQDGKPEEKIAFEEPYFGRAVFPNKKELVYSLL